MDFPPRRGTHRCPAEGRLESRGDGQIHIGTDHDEMPM
jgi:hypothetical protein